MQEAGGPVGDDSRIRALDALRGVALLGILVANVRQMFLPWDIANLPYPADSGAAWGDWLFFIALVDLKFLTLFSLLFGIGFALQGERLAARGTGFRRIYLRRVAILGLFGGLHASLLYPAEVLLPYAVTALVLLALNRLSPASMLRGGSFLLGVTVFWNFELGTLGTIDLPVTLLGAAALAAAIWVPWRKDWRISLAAASAVLLAIGALLVLRFEPGAGDLSIASELAEAHELAEAMAEDDPAAWPEDYRARFGEGSLIADHLRQYLDILLGFAVALLWRTLGLFLVGAGLYRSGSLVRADEALWRRVAIVGLGIGLPLSAIAALAQGWEMRAAVDWRWPDFLHGLAALPLAAGIGGWVFLSHARRAAGWLWRRIESAGRVALTNYVGQSLVMAAIAEPWGLGYYGKLDAPVLTGLAVVVFGVLAMASHAWLARYRMGPLEWLWRCGTYWTWLPNRVDRIAA